MASVKKNIIANFAGGAWSGLMGLIFVPFYIKLMGAEAYGLVGIFVSLQAIFAVLDLGLSQTLSREMARLSVNRTNADRMADTVRTLEVIYWGTALCVAIVSVLMSDFIAYRWLNPEHLSRKDLLSALWIMALGIGLRWPDALYMGGLNGLQRQVLLNILLAVLATVQGVGALVALWMIEPTVQVFFAWQALMALLQVVVLRVALWRSISSSRSGVFRREVLNELWRFAAGMTGISLVSTVLTQTDKMLLSKLLSLSEFGYYTFAASVAAVLYRLIVPIFTSYFPRLIELVSRNDQPALVSTYHQGCQLMAVVTVPPALTLAFYSKDILELWVRNPEVVAHTSLLVSLLVFGNMLHGFMFLPYSLQLAHGWTKFAFYQNLIAVLVLAPAIYFATMRWGAVGAAGVWIILNSGYVTISTQVMHLHLLKYEKRRWYSNDIGKPLVAVLTIIAVGHILIAQAFPSIITVMIIFGAASIAAVLSADSLRGMLSVRRFLGSSQ